MDILLTAAFNNRLTETFKMYVRDHTGVNVETRRILTVIFSFFVGLASASTMVFGGMSFDNTPFEVFAVNPFVLIFVLGATQSFGGALAAPILDILGAISNLAPKPAANSNYTPPSPDAQ